jgi:hypothetical protein
VPVEVRGVSPGVSVLLLSGPPFAATTNFACGSAIVLTATSMPTCTFIPIIGNYKCSASVLSHLQRWNGRCGPTLFGSCAM